MGCSTENSAYGPTRNPWDTDRVPGGSGGGSAAALAAFQAPLALGSDTGGSIRQPAALTATVGVKPTYGTVSRYGLIACASSLDQGGPCARTVLDTALLHAVIAGHDPRDSTSMEAEIPDVVGAAKAGAAGDLKGVRIGVVKQLRTARATSPACWRRSTPPSTQLAALGADVSEVDCPHLDYSLSAYYLILPVGGLEQPGPLRRHALRAAGRRRRHPQRRRGDGAHACRRFRPGSQAPHHDWHLRAVGGLLRRLLQPGAEGAHADRQRPRRRLRERRRAGVAGDPDDGVPARREGRRPAGDVPVRPVHAAAEPGRALRHVGAVGAVAGRQPAGRTADHGPGAGRRPALPGGRGLRGRPRTRLPLCAL